MRWYSAEPLVSGEGKYDGYIRRAVLRSKRNPIPTLLPKLGFKLLPLYQASLNTSRQESGSFQCRTQRFRFSVQEGQLSPTASGSDTPTRHNAGQNRHKRIGNASGEALICLRPNFFCPNGVSSVSTGLNPRALTQPDRFSPAARRNLPSALRSVLQSLSSRGCWRQVHGRPGRR